MSEAFLTNANEGTERVRDNPGISASSLWYGSKTRRGDRGFISEIYLAPVYRGGLELPGC